MNSSYIEMSCLNVKVMANNALDKAKEHNKIRRGQYVQSMIKENEFLRKWFPWCRIFLKHLTEKDITDEMIYQKYWLFSTECSDIITVAETLLLATSKINDTDVVYVSTDHLKALSRM